LINASRISKAGQIRGNQAARPKHHPFVRLCGLPHLRPDKFLHQIPQWLDSRGRVGAQRPRAQFQAEVAGRHDFADFISTDPQQMKFTQIEKEILDEVQTTRQYE
jgi:hypothetical protein